MFFSLLGMRRVLVTGMSGTGKSSALVELNRLGFEVVDTDDPGWTEWSDTEGGYVWRENRIEDLLACDTGASLFVPARRSTRRPHRTHMEPGSACGHVSKVH
jgi:hypothetical protein